jgi:hypothetical protein
MVRLTPEQQPSFIRESPVVFWSCKGVWGERGATNVHLESADQTLVQIALQTAYDNVLATLKKGKGPKR